MAMPEERLAKRLSLVDVLEPLSEEELEDLAQRCSILSLGRTEDFYRPQQHDGGLFLILEGHVRVYLAPPAGKQVTLELLVGGTALWAREMELLDDRHVHVQAVEPTMLAFMGREDLERLVLGKPDVGLRMMDLLAERLGSSSERMAEGYRKKVLSRLASQILRLLEGEGVVDRLGDQVLLTPYTHEELGTMIGAGRVAVNRALGRLQDEGVVELRRRRIRVRDLDALRRIGAEER